jgi:hypothetical protein
MDTYRDTSGDTFMVSTKPASFQAAQQSCLDRGGHLATYDSMDQQTEVELAFVDEVGHARPAAAALSCLAASDAALPAAAL